MGRDGYVLNFECIKSVKFIFEEVNGHFLMPTSKDNLEVVVSSCDNYIKKMDYNGNNVCVKHLISSLVI